MKTTLEIPDELFKKAKARAALANISLKKFVCGALHEKINRPQSTKGGWRAVFGKARSSDLKAVNKVIEREFARLDPEDWR